MRKNRVEKNSDKKGETFAEKIQHLFGIKMKTIKKF